MRKLFFAACCLMLFGCAAADSIKTTQGQQDKSNRDKLNKELQDKAIAAIEICKKETFSYLACVDAYAISKHKTQTTPTEIAEAALYECDKYLQNFKTSDELAYKYIGYQTAIYIEELQSVDKRAEKMSSINAQELSDRARKRTIHTTIKLREK